MYKQGKAPSRKNPRLPPRTPSPTWGEAGIVYLAIAGFIGYAVGKEKLVQLTRSKKSSNSFYGEDEITTGLKKAGTGLALITGGFLALVLAPGIYEKVAGKTPEAALGFGGKDE